MARLTTASPVFEDGGKLVGVVSTIIDFDYLWERIDTFTNHQQNMGLGGFAFLINDSGKVIAHQDDSMILNYNFLKQYDLTKTDFEQLMSNRETIHSDVNDMLQTFVKIAQTPGFTNDWYVGVAVSNEKNTRAFKNAFDQVYSVICLCAAIHAACDLQAFLLYCSSASAFG